MTVTPGHVAAGRYTEVEPGKRPNGTEGSVSFHSRREGSGSVFISQDIRNGSRTVTFPVSGGQRIEFVLTVFYASGDVVLADPRFS